MKIQYSYLKNFLQTKLSQKKLVDVFTQVGFECEIDGDLIEFDITPNRGDVLSLKGLEREFCAYQVKKSKNRLETFKLKLNKDNQIINQIDHSGCGNYHLMLIEGLRKIKNLDVKKRSFIESAGVPLIHPLVDLGNYVMLEVGAPMHVFDLDKLELPINVKFPKSNKNSLEVIGGDVKDVQSSSLTIQDQSGIQAIAGIIGSEKSAVSLNTMNIAVEAAFFKPETIVNQARKYGLATDASHRFERGVDPEIQKLALERYLCLLNEIAIYDSAELYHSQSKKSKKENVRLHIERFNNFSGLNMKESQAILILRNLGFEIAAKSSKSLLFNIPSHRFDISLEEDLYEELLRCYGYDNIPISKPKAGPIIKNKKDNALENLRVGFVHAGFKELMHMPFVSKESFQKLNSKNWTAAELQNPINENEPFLRGSLFKSLFSAININVKKGYSSIKVFEAGNVFKKEKRGFAAYFCHNTYVAEVLELKPNSTTMVNNVIAAVDCGIVVNPDSAINMAEGGIIDGIGNALYGDIEFKDGTPSANNFDKYKIIRQTEAPKSIEVYFVENNEAPTGLGEPLFPPVFAALSNAISASTGQRVYEQPFVKARAVKG